MIIYEKTDTALFIFTFWFLRSKTMFIFSVLWGINSYLYSMKCLDLTESFLQNLHLHCIQICFYQCISIYLITVAKLMSRHHQNTINNCLLLVFYLPKKVIIISDNSDIINNILLSMLKIRHFHYVTNHLCILISNNRSNARLTNDVIA